MEKIFVNSSDPIRLDRYLRRTFSRLTQGIVEKALRQGKIKASTGKALSNTRVTEGDIILIYPALFNELQQRSSKTKTHSTSAMSLAKKIIGEYLLFRHDAFFAINKPCGLAVQGGSKVKISIDEALAYLNEKDNKQYKLVHRLDKETSGVLLIADGYESSTQLGKAFKEKKIYKRYLAKVSGCPEKSEGFLSNYIGKDRLGTFEIVREQKETGKLAETHFKIISSNGRASLIELAPETGRMHQLRFHCKLLGCPIMGDIKYGGISYERMMLHASSLEIDMSIFGKTIMIQAPMSVNDHLLFSNE